MKRVSGVVGLPVVVNGRKVGTVGGIAVGGDGRKVEGIVTVGKLGGMRVIGPELVEVIGEVGLQCSGAGRRRGKSELFEPHRALSTGGERLGRVSDVVFDERNWRIAAVEVSPGYIDELLGRRMLCMEFAVLPDNRDVVVCALRKNDDWRSNYE